MASAVPKSERCASLYLFLAQRKGPASRADIERNVDGYEGLAANDETACKMLRRDIETLSENAGIIHKLEDETYVLDTTTSVCKDITLSAQDQATLSLAAMSALGDPDFPLRDELRRACIKLQRTLPAEYGATAAPTKENPEGSLFAKLLAMRQARKTAVFTYTKPDGTSRKRTVEPYALFSIQGEFYLIGRDLHASRDENDDGIREFKLERISGLKQKNASVEPDFPERNVRAEDYLDFPFAFGSEEPFLVCFLVPKGSSRNPEYLWENRAALFSIGGQADFELMLAYAKDTKAAARWCAAHSPYSVPLGPDKVVAAFNEGLVAYAPQPSVVEEVR